MPGDCQGCGLWKDKTSVNVPGEGPAWAQIALVGEALGAEEDERGKPFVGDAGDQLTRCLAEAGMSRSDRGLTHSIRCRPTTPAEPRPNRPRPVPRNRKPTAHEIGCCHGWLDDELRSLTALRVLVALGDTAIGSILGPERPAGGVLENQGKVLWSSRYQCWVVCSLNPAYILRKPGEAVWLVSDLLQAQRIAATGQPPGSKVAETHVLSSLREITWLRDHLAEQPLWVFDWESTGVHLTRSIGTCVAFCAADNVGYVVPRFGQALRPLWTTSELRQVDLVLREIFTSPTPKGGHNVAFDCAMTRSTLGAWPTQVAEDSMVLHHLVRNHYQERSHGLKRLAVAYTSYGRYDDELDRWLVAHRHVRDGRPDHGKIWLAPDEIVWKYNALDAIVTFAVLPTLLDLVRKEGLEPIYRQERLPLALAYAAWDRRGLRIHPGRLAALGADLQAMIEATAQRLETLAGWPVNMHSGPDVRKLLFEQLGLSVLGLTETGQDSTALEHLKPIEGGHEAVGLILHGRHYGKMKGTFVDGQRGHTGGIAAAVDPDGRVRMNTLLTSVETFRLATRRPFPVHTIPRPAACWSCPQHGRYVFGDSPCCPEATSSSMNIRSLVIPEPGWTLVTADYVQQELAILCIAAGQRDLEEAMLDRREDAHEYVMAQIFGKTRRDYGQPGPGGRFRFYSPAAEAEYKQLRSDTKRTNFLMLYLGSAKKLSRVLTTSARPMEEWQAQEIIDKYYERLDAVRTWQYQRKMELRDTGRVRGLFGTYRILPGIHSRNRVEQFAAERQACNFPIQNGGAHIMMRGLLALHQHWIETDFPGRILFSVHDEVITEVRSDRVAEAQDTLRQVLQRRHPELVGACQVPRGLFVDVKAMDAWGDHKEQTPQTPQTHPGSERQDSIFGRPARWPVPIPSRPAGA